MGTSINLESSQVHARQLRDQNRMEAFVVRRPEIRQV
jgi:hypothetical protein